VTAEPDAGPVLVREEVSVRWPELSRGRKRWIHKPCCRPQVDDGDTPASLKRRIQDAEARCLWKAIELYRDGDFSAIPKFRY